MADTTQNAMFEILKRIQADVSEVKTDVAALKGDVATLKSDTADLKGDVADLKGRMRRVENGFERLESRLEHVEDIVLKHRRENAGMLVMMRGAAGEFSQRMDRLERDVRDLKGAPA